MDCVLVTLNVNDDTDELTKYRMKMERVKKQI